MSEYDSNKNSNLIPNPLEYEKYLPGSDPSVISNQKISKPYLNKPVNCPWTSRAPLASTSNQKSGENVIEGPRSSSEAYVFNEHYNNGFTSNGFTNKYSECHRASSAQFFHFLRLMQLFPEVHPAALHTVMTLCRNDFFATVDKLLYAKRCKDLILKRQQILVPSNKGRVRYQPYSLKPDYNDNVKIVLNCKNSGLTNSCQPLNNPETQTVCDASLPSRALDSKRIVYKNKSKSRDLKGDIPGTQFTPVVSPQVELPIRPLSPSPDAVQNLTKPARIIRNEK